jgi:acetyltransferase-like isoleucine patch superfamily enzyme
MRASGHTALGQNGSSPSYMAGIVEDASIAARRSYFCSRILRAAHLRGRRLRGAVYGRTVLQRAGRRLHLGPGVTIVGGESIAVGEYVSLGPFADLNAQSAEDGSRGKIVIGDRVHIGGFGTITAADSITIEDDVTIAPRVLITDHQHRFVDATHPIGGQGIDHIARVHVCRGAWIGVGATILQGVTIGHNAVIGANSVVTESVPDGAVAVGAPARITKQI